jgi:hypothetical protein
VGLIDLEITQDSLPVGLGQVEQFEEKMLQIDLVMGMGEAEAGRGFKGSAAGGAKFGYQGL